MTLPPSLERFQHELESAVGRDVAGRRAVRRRRRVAGAGAALGRRGGRRLRPRRPDLGRRRPVDRRRLAGPGRRARPRGPRRGRRAIVHVRMEGFQDNGDGTTATWVNELWRQMGPAIRARWRSASTACAPRRTSAAARAGLRRLDEHDLRGPCGPHGRRRRRAGAAPRRAAARDAGGRHPRRRRPERRQAEARAGRPPAGGLGEGAGARARPRGGCPGGRGGRERGRVSVALAAAGHPRRDRRPGGRPRAAPRAGGGALRLRRRLAGVLLRAGDGQPDRVHHAGHDRRHAADVHGLREADATDESLALLDLAAQHPDAEIVRDAAAVRRGGRPPATRTAERAEAGGPAAAGGPPGMLQPAAAAAAAAGAGVRTRAACGGSSPSSASVFWASGSGVRSQLASTPALRGHLGHAVALVLEHERDAGAGAAGAAGAADAVDVGLVVGRRVEVDDVGDVVDVEAAGGDVGRDERVGGARREARAASARAPSGSCRRAGPRRARRGARGARRGGRRRAWCARRPAPARARRASSSTSSSSLSSLAHGEEAVVDGAASSRRPARTVTCTGSRV